ncbi:MAG: DMT family transporter [Bacilli bacterium]|nr:DMT family transporter [Bacilli bacterium]
MKKIKVISFIILIGVMILWGIAPVISKVVFDSYSPGMLIALRGLFAVIVMAIFINKNFKKINKSYLICIPAGLFLAAAYIFQFVGLKYTVPSKNAFLENISCITIPIFMFILVREKPTWVSVVSAIVCVIGSLFLVGNGFDFMHFFSSGSLKGDGLSAIGGLFFGLDIAFTKVFSKDKDPLLYVFLQLCVLTVVSFAYSFIFEGLVFDELMFTFDIWPLVQAMFLGVICTAICWVLRARAIKYIDAVTVSLLVPLSAVVASSLSIALQMEEFTFNLLIGGLIVLLSIAMSAIFDYRKGDQDKINNENNEEVIERNEPNQNQL